MTVDRIAFTKTFPVGMTWEKVMMEAEVWENENPKECLEILKKEVEDFHRTSNPQLYPNGKEAVVDSYGLYKIVEGVKVPLDYVPKEKVINRLYDDIRDKIKDCTTLEELAQFKEQCGKSPDLMPAYMDKLKSLT